IAEGKESREIDGREYILEHAIVPDVSLVKAYMGDKSGNLVFRKTARNFNPNVAMAGKITIVEVEKLLEVGEIDHRNVQLPGVFIDRIVINESPAKYIEHRTVRES